MNDAPVTTLPQIAILPNLPLTDMVTLVFYLIAILYLIFTGVLYYHWNSYASDAKIIALTYVVYFAITIPLLVTMGTSIILM
jgi:hypothetical protein